MARERGEEDSFLQLLAVRTCHCRLFGDKEQTLNLQEAIQKENLEGWDLVSESEEDVDTHVCDSWQMRTHLR